MSHYCLRLRVWSFAALLVFAIIAPTELAAAESSATPTIDTPLIDIPLIDILLLEIPLLDTPLVELLKNARARAVLEKLLPGLLKALEEDLEIMRFMGASSLRELAIDDAHVAGFDEEILEAIQLELQLDQLQLDQLQLDQLQQLKTTRSRIARPSS